MSEIGTSDAVDDWSAPRQPVALVVLKVLGVVTALVLFGGLLWRLAVAFTLGDGRWIALPAFLVGYLAADLMTGSVHWFCDTFFDEETPWIGSFVIQEFRDHHVHPERITRCRFLEQDTTNFFVMLGPLALVLRSGGPVPGDAGSVAVAAALAGLCTGSFGTNLFHKWAHTERPAFAVRWLQRAGLILNPERHQVHHRDYGRGYCVTSGWLNPLLDAARIFPRVEGLVRGLQRRSGVLAGRR